MGLCSPTGHYVRVGRRLNATGAGGGLQGVIAELRVLGKGSKYEHSISVRCKKSKRLAGRPWRDAEAKTVLRVTPGHSFKLNKGSIIATFWKYGWTEPPSPATC